MPTQTPTPCRHGFRCSWLDGLVLVAGVALGVGMHMAAHPLAWVAPAAAGHFFLFCNVFLVWRRYEMIWAALFVMNVLLHTALGHPGWWPALAWQTPFTLLFIVLQIRSPWYHGICASRWNPRLADYLEGGAKTEGASG